MPKKMRVAQVAHANGILEIVERDIPKVTSGCVRLKIQACGVCHSDSFTVQGAFPGIQYPRVPGHEIAGFIDEVGPEVVGWQVGQRVGVGWNGGYCGYCLSCRKGDFNTCQHLQVPGIHYDGGYAEYTVVPANALALIPDELSPIEVGPMMCAGITTFNALRNSGARAGDLVAILGIGGLGHLAIQFASKMGFRTIAIARGQDKEQLAKKLGAHHYIDSQNEDPAKKLLQLGGARLILATVTNAQAMSKIIGGLDINGKLLIVGAPNESIQVQPIALLRKRLSVVGWPSGTSIDSQDTMSFCAFTGVRSMNQVFPLEKAAEAYELMMSGKARFRVVLNMEQ